MIVCYDPPCPPLAEHRSEWPMASPGLGGRLRVVLRTARGQVGAAGVRWIDRHEWHSQREGGSAGGEVAWYDSACEHGGRDTHWDYWETELALPTGRFAYWFWVRPRALKPAASPHGGRPGVWWLGDSGMASKLIALWPFEWPHPLAAEGPAVPGWARGAFFYHVFVDRFSNGDVANDPPGTLPWPADAGERVPQGAHVFYGGDLAGVTEKLQYLVGLGVDAICLTPIFRSPTNHKYDTEAYLEVDPAFGGTRALAELTAAAHRHGIRVILDLPFNHSGDRFFAFRDVVERGPGSPYREWYFLRGFPVVTDPPNYETFGRSVASMPKLNTAHPEVRRYLAGVVRHWLHLADVDGFRLDVANETARVLWRDVAEAAHSVKPDVLLVGEIWHRAASWLREAGGGLHSVTNYPWRLAVVDFFATGQLGPSGFWERLEALRFTYAPPVTDALVNLLGSHDTPRFLTLARGEAWRLKLALLFLFAYPGVAQVYYGDEVGMEGGPDPDCRRPMRWHEDPQSSAVHSLVRLLGRARHDLPVLRTGALRLALIDEVAEALAFWRVLPGANPCLAIFNRGHRTWQIASERLLAPSTSSVGRARWRTVAATADGISVGDDGPIIVPPRAGALVECVEGERGAKGLRAAN